VVWLHSFVPQACMVTEWVICIVLKTDELNQHLKVWGDACCSMLVLCCKCCPHANAVHTLTRAWLTVSNEVCELAPYPLTRAKLHLPLGESGVTFTGGLLELSMNGSVGVRAETVDLMKFGLHEVEIRAAAGSGPVSAFYVCAPQPGLLCGGAL
jgi:hypothetical protein